MFLASDSFLTVMREPALVFFSSTGPLIPMTNGRSFYETTFNSFNPILDHEYDGTLQRQF